jgi:hypothetical protein
MAEHYWFKIGDAFPADDTAARWLTSLTMALNDLLYTNRRLIEGLKGDAAPGPTALAFSGRIGSKPLPAGKSA